MRPLLMIAALAMLSLGCDETPPAKTTPKKTAPKKTPPKKTPPKKVDAKKTDAKTVEAPKGPAPLRWAVIDANQAWIETKDLQKAEVVALREVESKYTDQVIPLSEPAIPDRYKRDDEAQHVILTPEGKVGVTRQGFLYWAGASEEHFTIAINQNKKLKRGEYPALRAVDANSKVSVKTPTKLTLSKDQNSALREYVLANVRLTGAKGAKLGDKERAKALRKLKIPRTLKAGKDYTVFAGGALGEAHHAVISVHIPLRKTPKDYVSGFFTVDASFAPKAILNPLSVTLERTEVRYWVDSDGDGKDELVINSSYYEGEFTYHIKPKGDGFGKAVILGGDGA